MQKIIISLGGSLIIPKEGINIEFLKKFRQLILSETKKGKEFFLICGGGNLCRSYNEAANKIVKVSQENLDWLGIQATRFNAYFIKTIFLGFVDSEIIIDPTKKIKSNKPITIAAGYKPGWSTDYVASLLAEKNGIKMIINLSNIDYAYDKDPKKFKDAKKIEQTTWKDFRKIVGNKWRPGLNMPFDPIASKLCEKNKATVAIMNGHNLTNLKNFIDGKKFIGTLIK